jgi:ribulose-5-phosphate 4-epimerase/fuculose-1-phosphate aldolase
MLSGHGYLSELVIPIIENTPHEEDLADSLGDAIRRYPKATAVLVRRHGIYIWGATWMQVRRHVLVGAKGLSELPFLKGKSCEWPGPMETSI